jgi:hypothetical protein
MNTNIPIIYPEKTKKFLTKTKIKKQNWIVVPIIKVVAPLLLLGKKIKWQRVKMKEPYILLYTHAQFADMPMFLKAIWPWRSNNISAIDGYRGFNYLLQTAGRSIPIRKFTKNPLILKNIAYTIRHNKAVLGMAPQANYSNDGFLGPIPFSTAKMIKFIGAPVVTLNLHGNYINDPSWGDRKARNELTLNPVMEVALSAEEIKVKTPEEIFERIVSLLEYNDWKYWREIGDKITYKDRAVGMEKILYKCPHCHTEFEMSTSGATIKCNHCQTTWELEENGYLKGEVFSTPDDWLNWEREEVKKEINSGTYVYDDDCSGLSLPNKKDVFDLGTLHVHHDLNGMIIKGHFNERDFEFNFSPIHSHNIHCEFNFENFKGNRDWLGMSTENDTIYWTPNKPGVCYKTKLASQEIYILKTKQK